MKFIRQLLNEEEYDRMRDFGSPLYHHRKRPPVRFWGGEHTPVKTAQERYDEYTAEYGEPAIEQFGPYEYFVWYPEPGNTYRRIKMRTSSVKDM